MYDSVPTRSFEEKRDFRVGKREMTEGESNRRKKRMELRKKGVPGIKTEG